MKETFDYLLHSKEKILGIGVLSDHTIHKRLQGEVSRISDHLMRLNHGTQRSHFVETFGEAPLRHSASVGRISLPLRC